MAHSPYQKRLLWLLNTFGKKYPRQASDTVQMLLLIEPTLRYGRVRTRWYTRKLVPNIKDRWVSFSEPDPVAALKHYVEGVESPTRSPLDRWGRWLFNEVKRAYRAKPKAMTTKEAVKFYSSLSGMLNPFKQVTPTGRTSYTSEDIRKSYRTPYRATRTQLAVQRKLALIWRELPGIREWLAVTGASLEGYTVAQAARAAACWHQLAVDAAMTEAQRRAGLSGGVTVGQLSEGWSLVHLTTQEELGAEGQTLHHCVGGYFPEYGTVRRGFTPSAIAATYPELLSN